MPDGWFGGRNAGWVVAIPDATQHAQASARHRVACDRIAMGDEPDWGGAKEEEQEEQEEQEEVKEEEEEDQRRFPPHGWPAARALSR